MLTFVQSHELAGVFNMLSVLHEPDPLTWKEEGTEIVFTEREMINCCWVTHHFHFVGSVEECLALKTRLAH